MTASDPTMAPIRKSAIYAAPSAAMAPNMSRYMYFIICLVLGGAAVASKRRAVAAPCCCSRAAMRFSGSS
jgi:hypothetical protein